MATYNPPIRQTNGHLNLIDAIALSSTMGAGLQIGGKSGKPQKLHLEVNVEHFGGNAVLIQCPEDLLKQIVETGLSTAILKPELDQFHPIAGITCLIDVGSNIDKRIQQRGLFQDGQILALILGIDQAQVAEQLQNAGKTLFALLGGFGNGGDLAGVWGEEGHNQIIVAVIDPSQQNALGIDILHDS